MCKRSIFTCCIIAICALVSIASPVEGDVEFGSHEVKRQTSPGNVNETQLLTTACNANPQDNFAVCVGELTGYINSSAAAWCQHQQEVLDDCLVANQYSQPYCTGQVHDFDYCANQTVAMYMNCLAAFTKPIDLYQCANINLFEGYTPPATTSIATETLPTSSLSTFNTLTGPIAPSTTTSIASSPSSTLSGAGVTSSSSSLSLTPVSESTTTLTQVVTATACPPDIPGCPRSSTFLSTITTTSVITVGGGMGNNTTSIPASSTPPVAHGAKEAKVCVRKKRTRILRRDEV